ncbi:response regulator [Candidatus Microgenomates bacterium]|nr:response regulator [Candidatus Microgenomates bacterium]
MAKILLVDDDQSLRQLYKLELTNRKHTVVEAADGEEGLAKIGSDKPDLVLLDVMMPKLDGIATLGKIKADAANKGLPVVMLTNFGQENLVKQAFNQGATDYLLKYKVTPAEMASTVEKLLA